MELVDTHTHYCDAQYDADRGEVLARAKQHGVSLIVEIADGPSAWNPCRDLAKKYKTAGADLPTVFWACGFHPHHAAGVQNFDFSSMKNAASDERCLAIGEIGLDYYKNISPRDEQIVLFEKSLDLARAMNKPVVIHCREAQKDVLDILKKFFPSKNACAGVIHCFSGDWHFAKSCLDLGFFIGVDGPVTYPNAIHLRNVIAQVPIEKIVLETDCPYLPPQPWRGKRNESSYLPAIAEKISEIFGIPVQETARITTENAKKLYRIGD